MNIYNENKTLSNGIPIENLGKASIGDNPFKENSYWCQKGWECPKCGRVYSPSTFMCYCCGNGHQQTVVGTGTCPININDICTTTCTTGCKQCKCEQDKKETEQKTP